MSEKKPNPNFSLRPGGYEQSTKQPGASAKPGPSKQPNPNYVPPASVKKSGK